MRGKVGGREKREGEGVCVCDRERERERVGWSRLPVLDTQSQPQCDSKSSILNKNILKNNSVGSYPAIIVLTILCQKRFK